MHPSLKNQTSRSARTPIGPLWGEWPSSLRVGLWITMLVLLLVIANTLTWAQQNLPDMGEPADNVLSPLEEKRLGRQFMRQIRARLPLQSDNQINEYIQSLGNRLATAAPNRTDTDYQFFILDEQSINAFAIPGGYIGVNAGLIIAMAREEQLAGVLAHEVAHLTQRHHARAFESAGKNRMSTAAAIIAAILISTSSTEAGQAALAAGLAIYQQSAINYTRTHEYEADRIGIQILSSANYDPEAIAETFEIMRRKNTINGSGTEIEYLRTHPLDNNRIAEARSRASQLPRSRKAVNQENFLFMQARLRVLSSRDDARLESEYRMLYERDQSATAAYALTLLAAKNKRFTDAEKYISSLTARSPDNLYVQLLAAQVAFGQGEIAQSEEILEQLLSVYPSRFSVVEQYAEQLVSQRKLQKTMQLIRRYQRRNTNTNNRAWRILANVQEKLGDSSASHESLANYFYNYGYLRSAEQQLKMALRDADAGSQNELRLRAQLKNIQEQLK